MKRTMTDNYLSANRLLGFKLRTLDEVSVGLRDLILDEEQWIVRYLVADAAAWAPHRGVLVTMRSVTGLDEVRGELSLNLYAEALGANAFVASGDGLDGVPEDGSPPPARRTPWRAEIAADLAVDPPPLPIHDLDRELTSMSGADPDFSAARWVRAETLRRIAGETADGVAVRVIDMLIDSADWAVTYLDVVGPDDNNRQADRARSTIRCLVPRQCIDYLNWDAETLHLAVWQQEMWDADLQPNPAAGGGTPVRILDA